ncbi:BspA family leucine-rich repeat surface protein [Enterococcus entomosocium]|uniref:BspA family leucine-rich repeat surface protein n=1 Tax=Enterococcus entomosocium TaxID=3034352 RepID=UPI002648966E|nr:BspA family leucine-rich repeat surface protein [Enterococcus entomosocium]
MGNKRMLDILLKIFAVCIFILSNFPFTILVANEMTLEEYYDRDTFDEIERNDTVDELKESIEKELPKETDESDDVTLKDSEVPYMDKPQEDTEYHSEEKNISTTGVWGTVPWEYDSDNQTIFLYGGEAGETPAAPWKEYSGIERINVASKVILQENSSNLFVMQQNLVNIENSHNLDFTNVTNMFGMFMFTTRLRELDMSTWDVSNVESMDYLFHESNFTTLDLSTWDVSRVRHMHYMFSNTVALNNLDVTGWNTESVISFDRMFQNTGISHLDISSWRNDSFNSKNGMFYNVNRLKNLTLGEGFHLTGNMDLPMIQENGYTGRWIRRGSNQVLDYDNVFEDSVAFMNGYGDKSPGRYEWEPNLSLWGTVPWEYHAGTQTIILYGGEAGIVEEAPWKAHGSVETIIVNERVVLPEVSSSLFAQLTDLKKIENADSFDTSEIRLMDWMFHNTSSLRELDVSTWDLSNVTSLERMFSNSVVSQLDVSNWELSRVTNMDSVFFASNIESVPVDNWDVSNVRTMQGMFRHSPIKKLNLSNWNVENVQSFAWMFQYSGIEQVNVSGWTLDHARTMRAMFQGTPLNELNVSSWDISNIDDLGWMFRGSSIRELDLSNWDTTNVSQMENMFDLTRSLKKITLGEASIFDSSVLLPEISESEFYTGNWLLQNHLDTDEPIVYTSSKEFMANYDGSRPGTYVWESFDPKALTAKLYPVSDQSIMISGYMTEEVDIRKITYQSSNGEIVTIENDDSLIIWGDYQDDSEWTRAFRLYLANGERLETGSTVSITVSKPSVHNTGDVHVQETVIKGISYEAGNITVDRSTINGLEDTEALHQLILAHSRPYARDLITDEDLSDSFQVKDTDLTIDINQNGSYFAILEVGNKAYQLMISIDVTSNLEHMRVTIPTKILFESLNNEQGSNRSFESQEYQIHNHSTIPVDTYVNRFVVEQDAGIHLLSSSESDFNFIEPHHEVVMELDGGLQPTLQLKLSNLSDSIMLYERMPEARLFQLPPRTRAPVKLKGHFYGPYPNWIEDQENSGYYEGSLNPRYRMVLRFVPRDLSNTFD